MPDSQSAELDLTTLRKAFDGGAAAFRIVTELEPAGGDGDKVFPPTYEGAVYALEKRIIDGEVVDCVLLDSVQAQANRLETALLVAHRAGELRFPLVEVDFASTAAAEVGKLTALEAPHRVFDGLFLACKLGDKPFRRRRTNGIASDEGIRLESASPANATSLFELCPTALIFGAWDSHGARGGLGEKFQRALVSEVIGIGVATGVRPASRIDPVIRTTKDLPVRRRDDGSWEEAPAGATDTLKLSKVGLGNVTPSLHDEDGKPNHGGVTLAGARQITVLSLPALRRLHFPKDDGKTTPDRDGAGRLVLAALALAAVVRQWRDGFSYRSRCDLAPKSAHAVIEQVGAGGGKFSLTPDQASALLIAAVREATAMGLAWKSDPVTLMPTDDLVQVVKRSRELAAAGN